MEFFALNPGDVVLVDEAGMAGTLNLDRLVTIAAKRGAVVRLLGDYRQLGAVESGGALRLIANESGAVELSTLYRFKNPVEAEATLKIRVGDTAGLDFYQDAGRIRHGSHQTMTEQVYAGWKTDMLAGRKALMVAATNADVAELCARARADRVAAGQVEPDGARLHDGNLAGFGDWIVTRDNNRRLRAGARDFVKNGDAWKVLERREDGALLVEHFEHHGRVLLPAGVRRGERRTAVRHHRAPRPGLDRRALPRAGDRGDGAGELLRHHLPRPKTARSSTSPPTSSPASTWTSTWTPCPSTSTPTPPAKSSNTSWPARPPSSPRPSRSAPPTPRPNPSPASSRATTTHSTSPPTPTTGSSSNRCCRTSPRRSQADSAWHAVLPRCARPRPAAGTPRHCWKPPPGAANWAAPNPSPRSSPGACARSSTTNNRPRLGPGPTPADADRYRASWPNSPRTGRRDQPGSPYPSRQPARQAPARTGSATTSAPCTRPRHRPRQPRPQRTAWPALLLALRRADDLGTRPGRHPGRRHRPPHAAHRHLAQPVPRPRHPPPPRPSNRAAAQRPEHRWPHMLRLLARLDHAGTDPADRARRGPVRASTSPGPGHAQALAAQLRTPHADSTTRACPPGCAPPRPVADPQWQPYLDARADLIRDRVEALAEAAGQHRPAWTDTSAKDRPTRHRARELAAPPRHLAAYRDQYQITDDDPDHPLGPYPERGRVGHRAYWIAAASLLALRGTRTDTDPSWGRLAADRYRTLTNDEQARIATELAGQLGPDWLGDARDPAADADQPVYQDHLAAVLVEHGHLDEPGTGSDDGQAGAHFACSVTRQAAAGIAAGPRSPATPATRTRTRRSRSASAPADDTDPAPAAGPAGPAARTPAGPVRLRPERAPRRRSTGRASAARASAAPRERT
jgi:hypothetical protein